MTFDKEKDIDNTDDIVPFNNHIKEILLCFILAFIVILLLKIFENTSNYQSN